jgi:hypothetical protein
MMDGSRSATQAKPGSEGGARGMEGWMNVVRSSLRSGTDLRIRAYPALRTGLPSTLYWATVTGSLRDIPPPLPPFRSSAVPSFHPSKLPISPPLLRFFRFTA